MKKTIRLTESELRNLIKGVIMEVNVLGKIDNFDRNAGHYEVGGKYLKQDEYRKTEEEEKKRKEEERKRKQREEEEKRLNLGKSNDSKQPLFSEEENEFLDSVGEKYGVKIGRGVMYGEMFIRIEDRYGEMAWPVFRKVVRKIQYELETSKYRLCVISTNEFKGNNDERKTAFFLVSHHCKGLDDIIQL